MILKQNEIKIKDYETWIRDYWEKYHVLGIKSIDKNKCKFMHMSSIKKEHYYVWAYCKMDDPTTFEVTKECYDKLLAKYCG